MRHSTAFHRELPIPPFDTVWSVWRSDVFMGYAVRRGRRWRASWPTVGRFHVDEDGLPRELRTRRDCAVELFMVADGIPLG